MPICGQFFCILIMAAANMFLQMYEYRTADIVCMLPNFYCIIPYPIFAYKCLCTEPTALFCNEVTLKKETSCLSSIIYLCFKSVG